MTQLIRDRLPWVAASLFAIAVVFVTPGSALAQRNFKPAAERQFRENVTLSIDSNLQKRFKTAEDLLEVQRWDEAISILQEIVQTENKGLVQVVPGTVRRPATYLNVATRCNVLISRVAPEGLRNYRQKIDPQAKRWYENWQRTRDETELLRIVRQAFLSSLGDEALLDLGEVAWDRGDFSTARMWWEQLIPLPDAANPTDYPTVLRYPDASLDQPSILARIILCSIFERNADRAVEEIRQFTQRFPTAEGWLGGERGQLALRSQQVLDDSRRWPSLKLSAEVETFGLSPTRFRMIPESLDLGALQWVHPLLPNLLPHAAEGIPFQNEPLSYFPVVYENTVLVNDSDSIHAWNILTGEPAWKTDSGNPGVIYPTVADESITIPDKICVGVPEFTMTIAENRLFARMGSPVTCASNQQRDLTSELVCLDLVQEGKLVWKTTAQELFHDDSWRFEGTPTVVGGRAYVVVCRRRPQLELMVVALDAAERRLLWQRPIGGFRTSVEDSHNRVSHLLLTAGAGRLFLSSDTGIIVALDSLDGRLEWALSYETRSDETPALLSDPRQKGSSPAIFWNGLLFVAPTDSDFAYCIEADTGRIRWQYAYLKNVPKEIPELLRRELEVGQRRENQWRHLLGIANGGRAGRLIVSGNLLSAIDIETGERIWLQPRPAFGRGLLAGDRIILPGRTAIDFFSPLTGELLRTVSLKTPDTAQVGGNLTLAHGMLLVAQPNRLAAYSEFSRIKQRIERDLTQRPDDTGLLMQLGELNAANGDPESAETAFQLILKQANQDDSMYGLARKKLAKLWQDAGNTSLKENNPAEAIDNWLKSLSVTDDPANQLELIFRLARTELSQDRPEAALHTLQSLLGDERLASLPFGLLTAGHEATRQMSKIIDEYGRETYEAIELAALQELESLPVDGDSVALRRLIQKYPLARAVETARIRLAERLRDNAQFAESYAMLQQIRQTTGQDQVFVQATLATIELLSKTENTSSRERLWESLSTYDHGMMIQFQGKSQSLAEALSLRPKLTEGVRRLPPLNLERTWLLPLAPGSRIVFPENEPPSDKFGSVLVCSQQVHSPNSWTWQCVDWQTGQIRWEEIQPSAAEIAVWTPVQLLIGSNEGWQARSPEDGRQLWVRNFLTKSTASLASQSTASGDEGFWPISFDTTRGFQIFDPNDGRHLSSFKPSGRLHHLFAIGSPQRLGISQEKLLSRSEAGAVETSSKSQAADRSLAAYFQTLRPTRTWMATTTSPQAEWTIQQISSGGEPWQENPLGIGDRIIGLTRDQHLVGIEIPASPAASAIDSQSNRPPVPDPDSEIVEFLKRHRLSGFRMHHDELVNETFLPPAHKNISFTGNDSGQIAKHWTYQNFATGQATPIAWAQNSELLAVSDGSLLMSFNPVDGARKWKAGLADFPVQAPIRQICQHNQTVFATSQGLLRGIDVSRGKVVIERYLGDVAAQWQTSVAWSAPRIADSADAEPKVDTRQNPDLLAVWPLGISDSNRSSVLICDAETGSILQRLRADSEPRKLTLNQSGTGILWTATSLSGLRPVGN